MAAIQRRAPLPPTAQYISLKAFNGSLYDYTVNAITRVGTLTASTVSAANAAKLVILRDGGIILLPGINSGVTVRMIFVRFTGASDGTMYSGYIDPLTPDVFSLYDPYGSIVVNPPVEDRYTSGEYTTGLIKGLAGLEISGGGDISGGMDISGAVNINLDSGAATTIYGTAIDLSAASIDVSGAISVNMDATHPVHLHGSAIDISAATVDVSGTVSINTDRTHVTNVYGSTVNVIATTLVDISAATVDISAATFVIEATAFDISAATVDISGTLNVNTDRTHVSNIYGSTVNVIGSTLVDISATTIDISGTVDISGSVTNTGDITTSGRVYQQAGNTGLSTYILVPVGSIFPYVAGTAPTGYVLCIGSAINRTTYADLFAVIGTTFGVGDGSTTFNVPDLRGRMIVAQNAGSFTSIGGTGGAETITLTTNELPAHTHTGTTDSDGAHTHGVTDPGHVHTVSGAATLYASNAIGNNTPGTLDATPGELDNVNNSIITVDSATTGISIVSGGAHTHTFTTGSTGSGNAYNNMNPYFVLTYIIKY